MAEVNPPRNDVMTLQWSRRQNVGKEAKVQDLVEVVVVAMNGRGGWPNFSKPSPN
jgi:hypothetical protein